MQVFIKIMLQLHHNNNNLQYMFRNSLQSNTYFQLFDPNNLSETQCQSKVYRLDRMRKNYLMYDKEAKSNICSFTSKNASINFPADPSQELGLRQRFINIQFHLFQQMDWQIQLEVSGDDKQKGIIVFDSSAQKQQKKIGYYKYPCHHIQKNCWIHLTIDLLGFCQYFKLGEQFQLSKISISGFFKLRKVYTTQKFINQAETLSNLSNQFIPKKFIYPGNCKHSHVLLKFPTLSCETIGHRKLKKQSEFQIFSALPKIAENKKNQSKVFELQKLKLPKLGKQNSQQNMNRKQNSFSSQSQRIKKKTVDFRRRRLSRVQKNQDQHNNNIAPEILTQRTLNFEDRKQIHQLKSYNSLDVDAEQDNITKRCTKFTSLVNTEEDSCDQMMRIPSLAQQQIEENIQFEESYHCEDSPEQNQLKLKPSTPSSQCNVKSYQASTNADPDCQNSNSTDLKLVNKNSYEGFGEKLIERCLKQIERPSSPPMFNYDGKDNDCFDETITPQTKKRKLDLVYDPILQCFYDCHSHCYYSLKK